MARGPDPAREVNSFGQPHVGEIKAKLQLLLKKNIFFLPKNKVIFEPCVTNYILFK